MTKHIISRIGITILTIVCSGFALSAQSTSARPKSNTRKAIEVHKPDLAKIKAESLNPRSQFYFPKLWEKYEKNDTVMTNEEYRYLYLGYMFQEDYDPYRKSPYDEKTDALKAKTKHTRQEVDTLIKYAELSLYNNPFDLRNMSFLVHALKEKQKDYRAKFWEYRLENLLGAIKSTGTGEDVDNAWYVINPAHEYDMMQLLGYVATDVDFESYPGFDILMVEPEDGRKGKNTKSKFFFNVIIPTEQFELKHPEDSEEAFDDDETATDVEETIDPDEEIAE